MCSYATVQLPMQGSAKGPNGSWFAVTDAAVYFDHPVHAMAEHTLNIDVTAPAHGPSARAGAGTHRGRRARAARGHRGGAGQRRRTGSLGSSACAPSTAESINPDDPLAGLVVGERPDPTPPDGWTRVA